MAESRIAALLRLYGVEPDWRGGRAGGPGAKMSIRDAADKIGISRETLARLLRPMDAGETRRIHSKNLDKIAEGLGIPRELLQREMMADWGYGQAVTASTVAEVLQQIQSLSTGEKVRLQGEVNRMIQADVDRQGSALPQAADPAGNTEPDSDDKT